MPFSELRAMSEETQRRETANEKLGGNIEGEGLGGRREEVVREWGALPWHVCAAHMNY